MEKIGTAKMGVKLSAHDKLMRWVHDLKGLEQWKAGFEAYQAMSDEQKQAHDMQIVQAYPVNHPDRKKIEAHHGIRRG